MVKTFEEFINEAAIYPQEFDMDIFKSLRSYSKKEKYCNDNLQRIASGSSRVVYKIDDNTVLKLAKNKKGLSQNKAEASMEDDYFASGLNLFAKVYDRDENYNWIESQLARKAKPTDFKRITGYDWKTFQNFVGYVASKYIPKRIVWGNVLEIWDKSYEKLFKSEEFKNNMWEDYDSLFYTVNEYLMNYQIEGFGDIQRISSWGVIQNEDGEEKLILIDYGLNNDTFNNHYKKLK